MLVFYILKLSLDIQNIIVPFQNGQLLTSRLSSEIRCRSPRKTRC